MNKSSGSPAAHNMRTTAYPGTPISVPEVAVAQLVDVNGPWIRIEYTRDRVRLEPDAVFFAVQNADPDNPTSLIELIEALNGDLVPVFRVRWRDMLANDAMEAGGLQMEAYVGEVSRLAERLGFDWFTATDITYERPRGKDHLFVPQRVHIAEIAARVCMLHCLLLAASGRIPVLDRAFHDSFPAMPEAMSGQELQAKSWLMLRSFSPYLIGSPSTEPTTRLLTQPTALEVCALQLYNATISDIGLKECAFCRRVFHLQRGRAKYSDHHRRPDAKYCTPKCANHASLTAYRTRKKAEKAQSRKEAGNDQEG